MEGAAGGHLDNPSLTVSLALAAGIIAQALSRHARLPGILLLLAVGVLLGPDVADVVRPHALGDGLLLLVGFAVAVILFEGGLNLDLKRLRRAERPVRRLVTTGALVTAAGGTLAARHIMGWDWRTSILFGTLVIVTGPTVVNPLLRRLRVKRSVATVLEAEGVLIDAVGAVTAAVALEVALRPSGETFALGFLQIGGRLLFGAAFGLAAGFLLATLLRFRNLVPEGLENVFTLSLVLALFQGSNALLEESGIAAVTVAGIVVGNARTHVQRDLLEFKEQLTVMLIGMLFVLLAADVRLHEVLTLGVPGLLTVAALVFLVRPVNVLLATWRTNVTVRERLFLCWLAPRGIVAAAIASLFAVQLEAHGMEGGKELRSLVFLVIAVTVLAAGLTGGPVAHLLRLRRPSQAGWAILGANALAREMAAVLSEGGEEVILLDTNPEGVHAAEKQGLRALYGNALEESVFAHAEIETRAGAVALTTNDEVNFLFLQKCKREGKLQRLYTATSDERAGVTSEMIAHAGGHVLFAHATPVDHWSVRLRRQLAVRERRRFTGAGEGAFPAESVEGLFLPLALWREGRIHPVGDRTRFTDGDEVTFLVFTEREEEARAGLMEAGWEPLAEETRTSVSAGNRTT